MFNYYHPTKQNLIKAAVALMATFSPEEITSEKVLEVSGISKGSLYHHFADFSELIEQAQVYIFARYVDQSVEALSAVLLQAKTRDDLIELIKGVTRATQGPDLEKMRYNRIVAISAASKNERMRKLLAAEQQRLTEALADLFRETQERGWGAKSLTPMSVAVFIQAYSIGRVVDDFIPHRMDEQNWYLLVDTVIEKIFFREVLK